MTRRKAPISRPLLTREMLVPPATDGPRWRSPTVIPLIGGPIPAGEVLVETQRHGDRANLTTLGGRRVCNYPLAGLERLK